MRSVDDAEPLPGLECEAESWTTSRCTPGGAATTFSTTRLVFGAGSAIGSGPLSVAARKSDRPPPALARRDKAAPVGNRQFGPARARARQ